MTLTKLIELFSKYGNSNDIVTLVDNDTLELFWTGKIKEVLKSKPFISNTITGFSSRLFVAKKNSFMDGFFIYVNRRISL